ncbi:hypothetical protein ACJJTC_010658, partial [Scirpophaga incertulas]
MSDIHAVQIVWTNKLKPVFHYRFVSCTPKMSKSLWRLSLSVLQQVHGFLYSADDRSEAAAKIYYKLTMDSKKESSENFQLDRRRASEFRITYSDLRVVVRRVRHVRAHPQRDVTQRRAARVTTTWIAIT